MISSIIDFVLLSALAATSGSVLLMYRRLRRFDALQGQAAKEFARSSEALDRARDAIRALQADGGNMAVTLAARLNEARMVMNDVDEATSRTTEAFKAGSKRVDMPPAPPAPRPVEARPEPTTPTNAPASGDGRRPYGEEAPVPAAERIRNAARARLMAEREASLARARSASRPPAASTRATAPHETPYQRSATRASPPPAPTGPVMVMVRDKTTEAAGDDREAPAETEATGVVAASATTQWTPPQAKTARIGTNAVASLAKAAKGTNHHGVTWHDLAKAAQRAG
ncbi:hypothetical protein L1787_03490 [Acuticoccus sp. M5D2P5]|uniref:hypothetical protein n=1 Tax=Acuticoccus kalidii TaxID=2910977 RepID=UPI001F354ABD|nr:hypothetical protein [Acuticoccus kalidii]MCF3932478.1 hypothetical protein [Acuticoccus kalidii]